MSKARNLSDFISDATIDATEIADGAVTAAKLHTSLDLSSKTVTFADDHISGNKIHGGVISDFASTGIDDNAPSTILTINSSGNIQVGGTVSALGKLHVNAASGQASIAVFAGNSDGSYPSDTFGSSIGYNFSAGGGEVDFWNNWTGANTTQGGFVFRRLTGASSSTQLFQIRGNGDVYIPSGDVGIGTTSPNSKLHINGSDSNLIANQIQNTEGSGSRFDLVAWGSSPGVGSSFANRNSVYQWTGGGIDMWSRTGDLRFGSSNELRFQISSTGDVLIRNANSSGTNNVALPGALIFEGAGWNTSQGSVPIQGQIHLWGAYNNPTGGSVEPALVFSIKGSGNGVYSNDDGPDVLTERMRLDNYGNLGIGVNPSNRLHIGGTNPVIEQQATYYTGLSSSFQTVFDLDTHVGSWASGVVIYVVGRENSVPGVNKSFARYHAVKTNSGWIFGGPYDTIKAGNDHGYPEVSIATDGSFQIKNRLGGNIGDAWITLQLVCS